MTLEIGLTLAIIVLTLIAFLREWSAPDVISLSVLCLVVVCGLVSTKQMLSVFSNEAPLTIAALFVIGGALEKSGAVDHMGQWLRDKLPGNTRWAMFGFSVLTIFFSAWMNNTAIVAILLPVALGFARSKNIAASRLLMPISYCSILGGCCTLIGTSTNLLVNGTLRDMGLPGFTMFQLAPLGIPMSIAGLAYLVIFGPKLIPDRTSIAGTLDMEERKTPLFHVLVKEGSVLLGQNFATSGILSAENGVHLMEVRRRGERVMRALDRLEIQVNDRMLFALHARNARTGKKIHELVEEYGLQILSELDGVVTELVIDDESRLIGKTLVTADFRQHYNCVVFAVHRDGVNVTKEMKNTRFEAGDTLLAITAMTYLKELKQTRDFILTDTPLEEDQKIFSKRRVSFTWAILVAVILVATLTDFLGGKGGVLPWLPVVPIYLAAVIGALILLWTKVVEPRDAYESIDWQVMFMLYGLLGLGLAMQNSGTAKWLADELVTICQIWVPTVHLPMVMLWGIFLLTLLLTEILSNNATAVMMVPIAVTLSQTLGVSHWPLVMAVTVGASTAFALPMGYQTHMMVYGPGGFQFKDFLRVGIPLNLICWVVACLMIPLIWPFHP